MRMMRRNDGAMAIFVSVVALFVLLPLVGLASSSIIRGGVQAELQMGADAGALAGAASIPVGDFEDLNAVLSGAPSSPTIPGAIDPLSVACEQARRTLGANGLLGDTYTTRSGAGDVTCDAQLLGIEIFLDKFGPCFDELSKDAPAPPADPTGALPPVPTPEDIREALRRVLPGLLAPGVRVDMGRDVEGPFEPLVNTNDVDVGDQLVEARARRRFKNVIVAPVIVVPSLPDEDPVLGEPLPEVPPLEDPVTGEPFPPESINLNDQLDQEEALERYDEIVEHLKDADDAFEDAGSDLIPDVCYDIFPALRDDFVDLFNPPEEGAPTSEEILDAAAANDETVLILTLVSGVPFFDFFPACIEKDPAGNTIGFLGCTTNAGGAFRASLISLSE